MLSSMALRSRTASGTSVSLLWDKSMTSSVRMAHSWTGNAFRSLYASEMCRRDFSPSTVGGRDEMWLWSAIRVSSRCNEPICGGKLATITQTTTSTVIWPVSLNIVHMCVQKIIYISINKCVWNATQFVQFTQKHTTHLLLLLWKLTINHRIVSQ